MKYGCLYEILNTVNHKRYIGITFTNPLVRWRNHQYKAFTIKANSPLYKAMNKYGIESFEFNLLDENVPEELLYLLERFWIKELSLQDRRYGYNLSDGGKVNRGYKMPKEVIEKSKIRMSGKGNSFYGKNHTDKSKSLISKAKSGRKMGKETRNKMSESKKGEKNVWHGVTGENHPLYGRERKESTKKAIKENMPHKKKVNMIEKGTNVLIKQFDSIKDAARWVIETNGTKNEIRSIVSVIIRACEKSRKSAYGYIWEYTK